MIFPLASAWDGATTRVSSAPVSSLCFAWGMSIILTFFVFPVLKIIFFLCVIFSFEGCYMLRPRMVVSPFTPYISGKK